MKYKIMTGKNMKIMTINVPIIFLEAFKKVEAHYPSRSEMMRIALREFLIKELAFNTQITGKDHETFIRIVRETPITKHQNKPIGLGNKYYLEGLEELEVEESMRDLYPDCPDYKYINENSWDFEQKKIKELSENAKAYINRELNK